MKKLSDEWLRMIIMFVIAGVVSGILALTTGFTCWLTFYQPTEPDNLHNFIYEGGSDENESC